MKATILDGNKILEEIKKRAQVVIPTLKSKPKLATIIIGNNPASLMYINMKKKACNEVGIDVEKIEFSETEKEETIIKSIERLNNEPTIQAILVQLPLPKHFNEEKILNSVSIKKDVDGLHAHNLGLITLNKEHLVPCTPKGICYLLEKYKIHIKGKNITIVGHSKEVGKPLAAMLLNRNATVTICHEHTKDLAQWTKQADILISATGVPHLIKENMVKENAVVIDVGIAKKEEQVIGDVDFKNVAEKASFITPVPGGVGPITIAMVIENILKIMVEQ